MTLLTLLIQQWQTGQCISQSGRWETTSLIGQEPVTLQDLFEHNQGKRSVQQLFRGNETLPDVEHRNKLSKVQIPIHHF